MTDPLATDPDTPSGAEPVAPKTPPPPLMGRAPRPAAVRIRKPVVLAAVGAAALLLSGSLAWAFIIQPDLRARARAAAEADRVEDVHGSVRPSDRVTGRPAGYDGLPDATGLPEPRGASSRMTDGGPASPPVRVAQPSYAAPRPARETGPSAQSQAAASGLFFGTAGANGAPPDAGPTTADPASQDLGRVYSPHGLMEPVSPFELKAGAVIPGVLLTAVDTARPGPVIATVSQNVYDSITGRHLLIPQGARLIGRHEGEALHGQTRAFLVWDRLILPNGKSLILTEEPGVDGQGAVGIPGRTQRRIVPLGLASLFAGAISTLGELARGGSRDEGRSFAASAGDAASIEAAQVGGRLIDRELQVRPSIQVVAGAPVRVLITRDLILEPWAS